MWRRTRTTGKSRQERSWSPAYRRIAASRLFDEEWYALQVGRGFDEREQAIRHYMKRGHLQASPHPLFEPGYLTFQGFAPKPGRDLLSSYLADGKARESLSPHPLFDFKAAAAAAGPKTGREGLLERWLARHEVTDLLPVGDRQRLRRMTLGELIQMSREIVEESTAQRSLDRVPRLHDSLEQAVAEASPTPRQSGDLAGARARVSVILPTYNRAGRLRSAIASVQAQTHPEWELLVVDDGSLDDTALVVEGVAAFDDRVRIVPTRHAGVCAARNRGLAEASGEYVAFLDSDNTWEPDFLAEMVTAMESQGWDMAHGIQKVVDRKGVSFRAFAGDRAHLLVANHVDLNVLVVRRGLLEEIGGFDESLRRAVDYDLVIRLAARAELHLVPVVGVVYSDDDQDADRISVRESLYWNDVVRNRYLVDWDAVVRERTPGRTSVILPMHKGPHRTLAWLETVLRHADDDADLELVLVGSGSDLASYRLIAGVVRAHRGGRVLRTPRNVGWPVAVNLGIAASTGEYLAVIHPGTAPAEGELVGPLVDALRAGADFAQPLVLECDDLVASAGAGFADRYGVPYPLLSRHNVRDLPRADKVDVPAVLSPVFAVRAVTALEHKGLDPLTAGAYSETELAMRASGPDGAVSVLLPDVWVVERAQERGFSAEHAHAAERIREVHRRPPGGTERFWRSAGFELLGHDMRSLEGPKRRPISVWQPYPRLRALARSGGAAPTLRWTIDIAAPSGLRGRQWGDLHFARSLAAALERLGQHVAIDFREARDRETRSLDDVVLVLRGLDEVTPRPGPVNLLWVISHPELVGRQECERFDQVFAAATNWSKWMSDEWCLPVEPLLQCTDPEVFNPVRRDEAKASEVLFVGNSRKIVRPSVRWAMNHGHEVDIYGADWEGYVPPSWVKAGGVPNVEVGALYASAGVVLNDHWDDMREQGFISNRLFDAAACGACIVSDPVEGIEEIFRGSVQTFRTESELDHLLSGDREQIFPDERTRRETAEYIAREHSFEARAAQLLEHVLRLRSSD